MSVNSVTALGRVGKIELSYTTSGTANCKLSLACNETWKDKTTGEKQEKCEWINCIIWGKLAETTKQYVEKGQQLYIEGKLATRNYENKKGDKVYVTEVIVNKVDFIGSKEDKQDNLGF